MNRLAFLFPGQGSQYVGMGKELYENHEAARLVFEEANEHLAMNLSKLCFEGSQEELTRTENTQPALLTMSVAAFRVYQKEIGVKPLYMAGHSLGEFSALTCAGVLSFPDALRIVRQRGRFMQESAAEGVGAMCAITGVHPELIEEVCRSSSDSAQSVVISNYNSPNQLVISGHKAAVLDAGKRLEDRGGRMKLLKVSAPFHSPLMVSAAARLEEELQNYTYHPFQCPVISNVTGLPYSDTELVIPNLTEQMTSPVKWDASMKLLAERGVTSAIEMGPQRVLTQLMKAITGTINSYSLETSESLDVIRKELKLDVNLVTRCLAAAVSTRNSNWNHEEYQIGVIEPYQRLQDMQDQLDIEGSIPDDRQTDEALLLVKRIFETKRVPIDEQNERFDEILVGVRYMKGIPPWISEPWITAEGSR